MSTSPAAELLAGAPDRPRPRARSGVHARLEYNAPVTRRDAPTEHPRFDSVPEGVETRHSERMGVPVERLQIDVIAGPDAGRQIVTNEERVGIGAAPASDLVLSDPQVSRFHLELRRTPAGIAYLAIVSTLVGFGAFYYLLRRYPVGWVSTIVLLVPLTGALSGVLVMGDHLSWYSALGGAAMLAGVGLIIFSPRAFRGRAATAGLGEEPRA